MYSELSWGALACIAASLLLVSASSRTVYARGVSGLGRGGSGLFSIIELSSLWNLLSRFGEGPIDERGVSYAVPRTVDDAVTVDPTEERLKASSQKRSSSVLTFRASV